MAAELALLEGTLGLRNGTKYGAQGERQVMGAGGVPAPRQPGRGPSLGGSASSPLASCPAGAGPRCRPPAAPPLPARQRLGTGSACGQRGCVRAGVVKSWASGQLLMLEMQPRQRAVAVKCLLEVAGWVFLKLTGKHCFV